MKFTGCYKIIPYKRGLRELGYYRVLLEVKKTFKKEYITLRHESTGCLDTNAQYCESFLHIYEANVLARWYRMFFKNKKITDIIPADIFTYLNSRLRYL